jgi:hypothetical protein
MIRLLPAGELFAAHPWLVSLVVSGATAVQVLGVVPRVGPMRALTVGVMPVIASIGASVVGAKPYRASSAATIKTELDALDEDS